MITVRWQGLTNQRPYPQGHERHGYGHDSITPASRTVGKWMILMGNETLPETIAVETGTEVCRSPAYLLCFRPFFHHCGWS
jgi:hypothetical protein